MPERPGLRCGRGRECDRVQFCSHDLRSRRIHSRGGSILDPFHEGERTAQERAGEAEMATRVGAMIKDSIGGPWRAFLEQQQMVVVASVSVDGALWASP